MVKKIIFVMSILCLLCSCTSTSLDTQKYTMVFSQTVNENLWEHNKDYLLSNATDECDEYLTEWFQSGDYFKGVVLELKDFVSTVENGSGTSVSLVKNKHTDGEFWNIVILEVENNKVNKIKTYYMDSMEEQKNIMELSGLH